MTLILGVITFTDTLSQGKISKNKKAIISSLEAHKDRLIEISDNIN